MSLINNSFFNTLRIKLFLNKITSSADKTIKIWDMKNNECLRTLIGHSEAIFCLEITDDGKLLSGCDDQTIKLWNIETGECLNTINQPARVYSLKMLTNNLLVVGYSGVKENLKVFDMLNKNQLVKELGGHINYVFGLEPLINHRQIISYSGDNTIKLWSF